MIVSIQQPIYDRMLATDTLANAIRHLREEFRMDMTRNEAQSNLEARNILLRCENKVIDEAEEKVIRV